MFVLAFAPATGHRGPDPVPALLEALASVPTSVAPERTLGEQALALIPEPAAALDATRRACELGPWCVGLGVGHIEQARPATAREARGQALDAALAALSDARRHGPAVSVRAADPRHADTAADAQAVLRLIAWMIATRNAGQWRAVRALREHPGATQSQIATQLGITQQTVSRALRTSGWREESGAYPLLVRTLAMIDLTSGTPAPTATLR